MNLNFGESWRNLLEIKSKLQCWRSCCRKTAHLAALQGCCGPRCHTAQKPSLKPKAELRRSDSPQGKERLRVSCPCRCWEIISNTTNKVKKPSHVLFSRRVLKICDNKIRLFATKSARKKLLKNLQKGRHVLAKVCNNNQRSSYVRFATLDFGKKVEKVKNCNRKISISRPCKQAARGSIFFKIRPREQAWRRHGHLDKVLRPKSGRLPESQDWKSDRNCITSG